MVRVFNFPHEYKKTTTFLQNGGAFLATAAPRILKDQLAVLRA